MKLAMTTALIALITSAAAADTVVREGQYRTSTVTRNSENGVYTATGNWVGNDGTVYERELICEGSFCNTNWTAVGRNGGNWRGQRETAFSDTGSTTRTTTTGPRGSTRERTITRFRN